MWRDRVRSSTLVGALPAAVIALLASGALVGIAGVSPLHAYTATWDGGLANSTALGITAVTMLPLLYAALAFAVTFRAGLYNTGIEGQLYFGALASVVVALKVPIDGPLLLICSVLAGTLAGALWGIVPAVLKVWRGVNEIVSSLFLNYVAIYFTNYLLAGPLEAPDIGVAQTVIIPKAAQFPVFVEGTKISGALILAAIAVFIVWQLFRTPFGFDLRIMGGSRRVADYLGIRTARATIISFAISGGLGGLAGVTEVLGNQYFLSQDFSPGWGYTGIAVAVLGGITALGVTLAALFFGIIGAGALQMQFVDQLSPFFAIVVQAIAVIAVLLGIEVRNRMTGRRAVRRSAAQPPSEPTQDAVGGPA
jgi:simple sugar transport system permease protein